MAQLVARLVRNEKVRGSNPLSSTTFGQLGSREISTNVSRFSLCFHTCKEFFGISFVLVRTVEYRSGVTNGNGNTDN